MKVVSIMEAASIMSVGRSTVYRLIGENHLATIRIGRRRLVHLDSINTLLKQGAR